MGEAEPRRKKQRTEEQQAEQPQQEREPGLTMKGVASAFGLVGTPDPFLPRSLGWANAIRTRFADWLISARDDLERQTCGVDSCVFCTNPCHSSWSECPSEEARVGAPRVAGQLVDAVEEAGAMPVTEQRAELLRLVRQAIDPWFASCYRPQKSASILATALTTTHTVAMRAEAVGRAGREQAAQADAKARAAETESKGGLSEEELERIRTVIARLDRENAEAKEAKRAAVERVERQSAENSRIMEGLPARAAGPPGFAMGFGIGQRTQLVPRVLQTGRPVGPRPAQMPPHHPQQLQLPQVQAQPPTIPPAPAQQPPPPPVQERVEEAGRAGAVDAEAEAEQVFDDLIQGNN